MLNMDGFKDELKEKFPHLSDQIDSEAIDRRCPTCGSRDREMFSITLEDELIMGRTHYIVYDRFEHWKYICNGITGQGNELLDAILDWNKKLKEKDRREDSWVNKLFGKFLGD